ncbi:hypothetical protein HNV11_07155 [Spirosoma taeanense]|uniref:Ig-like domain-containing protein n=1 Tax=Spirosoma taeanense TaxID=2735870 RepID=A0A6M5Y6S4_9BACT|nr:hypothetical protein [Spirosoma taeanense]QJW89184.1 hypothetical protein HNV11_07155 [Spirosoma taeanense]
MHFNFYSFRTFTSASAIAYLCLLACLTLSSYSLLSGKEPSGRKRPSGSSIASAVGIATNRESPRPLPVHRPNRMAANDPIRFSLRANKQMIRLGETIELTITAELLNVSPNLMFFQPGSNAYRLKLLLPAGFEQTGGDFSDYLGDELSHPARPSATYRVVGRFHTAAAGASFRLLRGTGQANDQSLFVEKTILRLKTLPTENSTGRQNSSESKDAGSVLYINTDIVPSAARVGAEASYRGFLDFASCDAVGGWALDAGSVRESVSVDIYINGQKATTLVADQARQDVADAYGVTGFNKYGYSWRIPESYKHNAPLTVSVKITGTSQDLALSPRSTDVCVGAGDPPKPEPEEPAKPDTLVQKPEPAAPAGQYVGFLDFADCNGIGGWILDRSNTRQSQRIDIYINGRKVTTIRADQMRQDVADAFGVHGFSRFGYSWEIPASYKQNTPLTISVKPAGTATDLSLSPRTTAVCPGPVLPPQPEPKPDNCAFTIQAPSVTATCGSSVTLNAECSGANCNDITYTWTSYGMEKKGQTITATVPSTDGVYSFTVTASRAGCANKTATGTVTVSGCNQPKPEPKPEPKPDTCAFVIKTQSLTAACGGSVTLKADCNGANCDGISYTWKGKDLDKKGQSVTTTAPSTDGVYSYTVTAERNGCASQTSVATVTVSGCTPPVSDTCGFSIKSAPVSATCSSNVTLLADCEGNCDGLTYTWKGKDLDQKGQFVNITAPSTNGTYSYTVTASRPGCTDRTVVTALTVSGCKSPDPKPDTCAFVIRTQSLTAACGTSVTLNADCNGANCDGITYTWKGRDLDKRGQSVTTTVPAEDGTFSYTVTASRTGCATQTAIATVLVSGCKPPVTDTCGFTIKADPVTALCGNSVRIVADCEGNCDGLTYAWKGKDLDQKGQFVTVSPPATNGVYSYTVTVSRPGCVNRTAIARVTVNDCVPSKPDTCAFVIKTQSLTAACGSSVTLKADCNGANCDGISYTWKGKDLDKKGQSVTTTVPSANGVYSYTVTATRTGCASQSAIAVVTIEDCTPPIQDNCGFSIKAAPVSANCGSEATLLADCMGNCDGLTYAWKGNGVDQKGQFITIKAPSTNGTYSYTVTASRPGCTDRTTIVRLTVSGCTPPDGGNEDYPILNSPYPDDKRPVLQNERVRVAIDLGVGAVIREVTDLQVGENMINCMIKSDGKRDPGRDDQISLYAMPSDNNNWTVNGKPVLSDIGYNPVQGGSIAGEFSPVLAYGRTDKMLYAKTRGLHWGLSNEPGDYIVEQWIKLEGNIVRRHIRITGSRPDETRYTDTRQQELPCTYTNSAYYQYYVVQGEPYTGAPLVNVNTLPNIAGTGYSFSDYPNMGQMGPYNVDASEPWIMAVRPNTNRGLALHTPFSHEFKAALFGELGYGPAESSNAGYIANGMSLILDRNGVYEFDVNMVVGTLDEMRNTVNRLPRSETKPNYRFAGHPTRHGFYLRKGYDQGFPVGNELIITPVDRRFRLSSPHKGYKASEFNVIYVRMRAITTETQLVLDWRKVGQSELEAAQADQAVTFTIKGDNQYHTIAIPVGKNQNWNGIINEFSIRYANPTETPMGGQELGVKWISATDLGDQ